MSIKLTKQELKTPDEVWQFFRSLYVWFSGRLQMVVVIGILLFSSLLGTVYYSQVSKKKEGEAQYHFSLALSDFQKWKTQAREEKDKTKQKILAELSTLQNQFQSSRANNLAHMIRAELAWSEKKEEAFTWYENYAQGLKEEDKALAWLPLAKMAEEKKDWQKALTAYENILNLKENIFKEEATLGKARTLQAMRKKEEARKVYQGFLEKFPTSLRVRDVRGLLALMDMAP